MIRRDKGGILHSSLVSPQRLALPRLLPCSSLDSLDRHLLNQRSLVYAFHSCNPVLPRFPPRLYISLGLWYASSPLLPPPRSRPSLPLRGLWSSRCDVFAGASVLRLWLQVTCWRHPVSRVFRPTSTYDLVCSQTFSLTPSSPFSCSSPSPSPSSSSSFPSLGRGSALGTTLSYRRQVLRPELLATC